MQPFNRLRLFHWALAGLFALVWLSGEDGELLHVWTGYALLAVLLLRPLLGLLQVRGFPRLRPQSGNRGEVLFGRVLTLAMLGSFLLTSLLGLALVDNGEVLGQALSPLWPDAQQALGGGSWLDLSEWLEDPAEVHEFMANLSLTLVAVHAVWIILRRRRMAVAMLRGTARPATVRSAVRPAVDAAGAGAASPRVRSAGVGG